MDTQTSAVRTVDGLELPAPGVWNVDPGHAEVAFVGRHFMLTKVRGRFTGVDAAIEIGEKPTDTRITAIIDMATVSSGDQARDDHLRSDDFFDVDKYPTATFRSTSIDWDGSTGTVDGTLRIKDVERPVTLDVTYLGYAQDPWGGHRAVFDAAGAINREDWGLTWNMVLDSGGLLVSKEIQIELHVELVKDETAGRDAVLDVAV